MINDTTNIEFLLKAILISLNKILIMMPTHPEDKIDKKVLLKILKQEKDLAEKLKKYNKKMKDIQKDPFGAIFNIK